MNVAVLCLDGLRKDHVLQRGFDIFDYIRGQERDKYRSPLITPEKVIENYTLPGNLGMLIEKARQHLTNVSDRELHNRGPVRVVKDLYAAEVTMTDEWFGRFMNRMEDPGLREGTLLFVFSDHGVALGEHGYTGKAFDMLRPQMTDIPYFVHRPDGAVQTSGFYASNHDIAQNNMDIVFWR